MPHEIINLNNHIKLIHKEIKSPVSHLGVLVNAGTRDEAENLSGIAHFVEHTIFKGTTRRKGYQVIRRMEDVGGDINASTSKEETWFHSSFLSADYQRAVELLADIFFHATFPEKELEKEKDVVYEEIKYYRDTPSELIFDEIEEQVFNGHPLGRAVLGSKKSVKSIKRDDILSFIQQNYTNPYVVISSAGDISTKKLTDLCNHYFGTQELVVTHRDREAFTNYQPKNVVKHKNTNQTHLIISTPAYSLYDDNRHVFMLIANLLGGQGMNTRLNMAIREKLGLAYTVEASYTPYTDTGLFSIYAGCDNNYWQKCIDLSFKEIDKLKKTKLGTMQMHYARKQFLGQLAIAQESKLHEMLSIGRSALFYDQVDTIEETIAQIESITAEQIWEVANQIFVTDHFSTLIYTK
ncbi:insulinase family protein [Bacteroidales bacterium OttesenSCG-928-B11]|nr:insulinase family protein [Bacteroidales bacterium OttesenSCG-928-E04]MDL2308205.1 insulinase family protein [Bacteroidales bacterium OttesenSCG-928-C03]MDL2312581.1 insulinase family protein [Bacteroidales bacterium OttesenSCG-928-B11]MDL2325643.1 insulinase family protein [Bacteroidales bacterium OttesenSCG-928-A14]